MKTFSASFVLLFSLSCGIFLRADELKQADILFEKRTFQEALKEYKSVYEKTADRDVRWKSFFRICESLAHLYRYGEAAQMVVDLRIPEEPVWYARISILKIEILKNYISQYAPLNRGDIVEGEEKKDMFRLTTDEIHAKIKKTYMLLWDKRDTLVSMITKKEGYFFDLQNVDFGMYPTLFDYIVFNWTAYLLQHEDPDNEMNNVPNRDDLIVTDNFKRPLDCKDPSLLVAAELMETAGTFTMSKRREAAERWKIRRLLLAEQAMPDEKEKRFLKIGKAVSILLFWMEHFISQEARAEAGYHAAVYDNQIEHFVDAVTLCKKIEHDFSHTYSANRCVRLRAGIEMPVLDMTACTVLPPGRNALSVQTRNIKKVFFRLYTIDPYQLKEEMQKINRGSENSWSPMLHYPQDAWLVTYLPEKKIYAEWHTATDDTDEYKTLTKDIDSPVLETGIYLVLASDEDTFTIGSTLMRACFVTVTDLVMVGTAGPTLKTRAAYYDAIGSVSAPQSQKDEMVRFYTFDAATGKPSAHVPISAYMYHSNDTAIDIVTDQEGIAGYQANLTIIPGSHNDGRIDPLAHIGTSYAYGKNIIYYNYRPPEPIRVFIQNDRPLYRPGDTLQAQITAVKRTAHGFDVLNDKTAQIIAYDVNGKDFFTQELHLNEYGSGTVSFQLPAGRLLGQYHLQVRAYDGRFNGYANNYFTVEEYKKPAFEVILQKSDEIWKYGKPVLIQGNVQYYFGGQVPDAHISYRIKRQVFIPWYFRWYFERIPSDEDEVASGTSQTDEKGNFTITFTPVPSSVHDYGAAIPDITRFVVDVEARDAGGRTITAQQEYKAGKNAFYFTVQPAKGFFIEKSAIEIKAQKLTANDEPSAGKARYEIVKIQDTKIKPLYDKENKWSRGQWEWVPPLDVQLKDVTLLSKQGEGRVFFNKEGKGNISITSLPQGTYRITLSSKDGWGGDVNQSSIFVVASGTQEALSVPAGSVTLVENDAYQIGDTARFVIGSGLAGGIYHVELWAGEYLISRALLETGKPVHVYSVPITNDMKGGFTLRWFGVKNLDVYHGSADVSVPWDEKKLTISLDSFHKELTPGEKVRWGIIVKDYQKKPVQAEMLMLMYDRALEYYRKDSDAWLDSLYQFQGMISPGIDSTFLPYVRELHITEGLLKKILDLFRQQPEELQPPSIRSWRTWSHRGIFGRFQGGLKGTRLMPLAAIESQEMERLSDEDSSKEKSVKEVSGGEDKSGIPENIKIRKEFADTAFFMPQVRTLENGKADVDVAVPEQLTSWRIQAYALTKDVKEGVLSEEAVTKKDLMVRLDVPRFFREKDKGTISAIVHNESANLLEGELNIDIKEKNTSVLDALKLNEKKNTFSVKPKSMQDFHWLIEIPQGITNFIVTAAVRSGKLSDAEERELPILPSRQRLIESTVVAVSGDEQGTVQVSLPDDPTRINESVVLQIDPQLALPIINTIPFLIRYPYNCVEQLVNKYVPLAIMNELYRQYPAIKKVVQKIPKRDTVTPAWEKEDPRRMIQLMETPWMWESEGRPSCCPLIDMLDPRIVKEQQRIVFEKIASAQTHDGGFPWLPGGREDVYMTLYVLAGFAEARRYNVEVPRDVIRKALRFVNKKIPLMLKPEEYNLSIVSYAAYVLTSFPAHEFPEAKDGVTAASSWVVWLERHIHALTPLGKAYLAYTYFHLHNKIKAAEILETAFDGFREDPAAGVYWTPEKYSWVWYRDTVEKHAFFLKTLIELKPQDTRIKGMVQWLLFNRKGNVWKSTKASTAAVYALLHYLKSIGALSSDEMFEVTWGDTTESVMVKADEWLDKPLRWEYAGFKILPAMTKADIQKSGPGFSFASLTWTYSTDMVPQASEPGMLAITRSYYKREKKGKDYHLIPITSGDTVQVGDQIEIQLKINTRSQFEYMHILDPKGSGFESETLLSGWKYEPLWMYEEVRDSLTNFFMDNLPHGEYIVSYRMKPTKAGTYRIGACMLQSMYAPEMTAHSAGFIINVK